MERDRPGLLLRGGGEEGKVLVPSGAAADPLDLSNRSQHPSSARISDVTGDAHHLDGENAPARHVVGASWIHEAIGMLDQTRPPVRTSHPCAGRIVVAVPQGSLGPQPHQDAHRCKAKSKTSRPQPEQPHPGDDAEAEHHEERQNGEREKEASGYVSMPAVLNQVGHRAHALRGVSSEHGGAAEPLGRHDEEETNERRMRIAAAAVIPNGRCRPCPKGAPTSGGRTLRSATTLPR